MERWQGAEVKALRPVIRSCSVAAQHRFLHLGYRTRRQDCWEGREAMQDDKKQASKNKIEEENERLSSAEAWLKAEEEWIRTDIGSYEPSQRFSLALSGGGVRAAAVARGLIDVLTERSLIKQLDYVSSVSGGGYASGELIQKLADANGTGQCSDRDAAPTYSSLMALWWCILEALMRVWLMIIPAAGLTMLTSLWVPRDYLLAVAVVLAVVLLPLIGRQGLRARRLQRLVFGSFVVFSLVILVDAIGLTAVSLVMVGLLLWAWVYVRVKPHRIATLREMQHWPKMVLLSLSVASVVLVASNAGMRAHPCWIGVGLFIWALSAIVYVVALHRNINAAQPLFSYYREQLSRTYLSQPQVSLSSMRRGAPYPIFNVTANAGEQEFQMEIAPLFIGPVSEKFEPTPDGISMADAVASSASALDFTRQGWNVNAALSFVLGGTGYWLPKAHRDIDFGRLMRAACNMPGNGTIRLADGGFTDNLGLMALLRRKAARIVCLDAAYDPQFQFEDLRRVCHAAVIDGVADIDTSGLHNFGDGLRFAQKRPCFLKLSVRYDVVSTGEIWLIKLHHHNAELRKKFFGYPHITTSDQQLLPDELQELRRLGGRLAAETLDAMKI